MAEDLQTVAGLKAIEIVAFIITASVVVGGGYLLLGGSVLDIANAFLSLAN